MEGNLTPAVGESHRSGFHRVGFHRAGIHGVAMFNDFKDNRVYALAWVFTAIALAFAVAINIHVRSLGEIRGNPSPQNSGNLSSSR